MGSGVRREQGPRSRANGDATGRESPQAADAPSVARRVHRKEAVGVRNDLFAKVMNPAEPHNPSLVRKHYAALRAEMDDVFGKLFEKLSKINEQK